MGGGAWEGGGGGRAGSRRCGGGPRGSGVEGKLMCGVYQGSGLVLFVATVEGIQVGVMSRDRDGLGVVSVIWFVCWRSWVRERWCVAYLHMVMSSGRAYFQKEVCS